MNPKIETVGNLLYWAYANLAMAHAATTDNSIKYNKKHYFIRSRLYKGLQDSSMNIRSFFDDERLKMTLSQSCCYCGSTDHLAADHIIPRKKGGLDIGENLIWACRSCNSSKSATDMLQWMQSKNMFPSILLYRRYLKLLINHCRENKLIDTPLKDTDNMGLPFNLYAIPQKFLPLSSMKLWVIK
ncbi:MAG: HNH endonuclease [Alphaproteobacteria bacterium]|nr:HNH endonuclease [Alphaproteobacteria bacterium]